jgi:GDP-L-fucose synthase
VVERTPCSNFFFVDDMAICSFALENVLPDYLYNVGTGEDLTIKQLAETIQKNSGHQGEITGQ